MGLFNINLGNQYTKAGTKVKEIEKVKWKIEYEFQHKKYEITDYFPINAGSADARKYVEKIVGTYQFHILRFYKY